MAALAHCISVVFSVGFPFVVLPLCRFPALSLFPGANPAQLDKCFSDGKRLISRPVSAKMVSALCLPMPGISSSFSIASSYSPMYCLTKVSISPIRFVMSSICATTCRINCFCKGVRKPSTACTISSTLCRRAPWRLASMSSLCKRVSFSSIFCKRLRELLPLMLETILASLILPPLLWSSIFVT